MVYKTLSQYKNEVFVEKDELVAIYVSKQFSGARADNITFITRGVIDALS